MTEPVSRIRVDKWLWFARFFKTRSLAARVVSDGGLRLNAERVGKASAQVGPGDVLTFSQGRVVRVIRVEAIGTRRGPASEAQALYTDLTPPAVQMPERTGPRPTKRDRRALDALRGDKSGNED